MQLYSGSNSSFRLVFFLCKYLCLMEGFLKASLLSVPVQAVLEDKLPVIRVPFSAPMCTPLSLVVLFCFCTVPFHRQVSQNTLPKSSKEEDL